MQNQSVNAPHHEDRKRTQQPLPAVLDVPTAGRLLGLGRSAAYDLVLSGGWPTPVLRLGRRWRIPTAPLLALLGASQSWIDSRPASPPGATISRGGVAHLHPGPQQ